MEKDPAVGPQEFVGVGAGESAAEGVCRGLQKCLDKALYLQQEAQPLTMYPIQIREVEDERCQFYLKALTTMHGTPDIYLGEEICGFPVVWISTRGHWHGSVDINVALAFRKALQQTVMQTTNQTACVKLQELQFPPVFVEDKEPQSLKITACNEMAHTEVLQSALQVLKKNRKRLLVFDLATEPFLKELAGVYGVLLREEEF